ncbi:hypothetical protein JCM21714_461 [Gracilibacillus boraciitolerans JCM 21714]|uniref:Uncharacterized protein n=1 Tax=Gracilibacillus boraciitolerans JCM 21714 TaxID=1298598 RepID=W4VEC0_9BACI|nr:hypothetical protein JCM21714_461 [Gracilibacillus boraciitolerans JCM 21714]
MTFNFMMFIIMWTFILLGLMVIGGYFMFRKFLKKSTKGGWQIRLRLGKILYRKIKTSLEGFRKRLSGRIGRSCT